jgi:fructosamine-3-kinase
MASFSMIQRVVTGRLGPCTLQPVGGGSINETYKAETGSGSFFCKVNSATKFPHLFEKEALGLARLGTEGIIKVPEVLDCFETDGLQLLLLQWVESGSRTDTFWKKFGAQLAQLHHVTASSFGLEENNYMGAVPQSNTQQNNWIHFFTEERLKPLVEQCSVKGLIEEKTRHRFEKLYPLLDDLFEPSPPSLLHGDLWSGNFMCSAEGEPVLVDPAVYFGHRSMDLGMTTLFGGFTKTFYEAYHDHYPFPSNYEEQWQVCNLYPLLIHVLLFGSSYVRQVETILKRFV